MLITNHYSKPGEEKVESVDDQQTEEQQESAQFIAAILEGHRAVEESQTTPAEQVFATLKAKYPFLDE